MSHENLRALNAWCKQTGVLHVWPAFQDRDGDWIVRVLTHAQGKSRPLRTHQGGDLESVCGELISMAQKEFESRKTSIMREHQRWSQHKSRQAYGATAEIEAMHHTATDF